MVDYFPIYLTEDKLVIMMISFFMKKKPLKFTSMKQLDLFKELFL